MQRRTFLEFSASVLASPLFAYGAGPSPHYSGKNKPKFNKAKSVINIFLDGGISHIDFTHANPRLPVGIRSVNGEVQTKTPDLWLGADWQKLATTTDKLTVVHSHFHNSPNHETAKYWAHTGYFSPRLGGQEYPSRGSYVAKFLGPSNELNGLPVYLRIGKTEGDESGFIGSAYNPFDANSGTDDLVMALGADRFNQRLRILDAIDQSMNKLGNRDLDTMNKMRKQAVSMISGNLKKVFEIEHEPKAYREGYGENNVGNALLLARRLVEAGGQYVNVNVGGWDMHNSISQSLKQRVPNVDKAIFALLTDLEQRGMLKDTLVLITTDFGRTVKVNNNFGRDHWSGLSSLVIAGGKYEHGRVYGKADNTMGKPDDNGVTPADVSKVVFDHFDVVNGQVTALDGRPHWIYPKESRNFLI